MGRTLNKKVSNLVSGVKSRGRHICYSLYSVFATLFPLAKLGCLFYIHISFKVRANKMT